ncbi:MAG: hypothetical protein IT379_00120 [Deltaproteobacteria bacterium]|nr:hypothetical protein [Deltaproteobacteria bacterium]
MIARRSALLVALLAALAPFTAACGGSDAMRVTSPFSPELVPFFDDAVDFIAAPDRLEGRWADDWMAETQQRVRNADLITRVRVETLHSDSDPERRTSYRIVVRALGDPLYGEPPETGRFELRAHESSPGFATVRENERRLAQGEHLVFVKWYEDDMGTVRAHWHLSPASSRVIRRVQRLVSLRTGDSERGVEIYRSTTVTEED